MMNNTTGNITPAIAAVLALSAPKWKRGLNKTKVNQMANSMTKHGSRYDNAHIVLGYINNGDVMPSLLEGHHTCAAIVQSGVTINASVRIVTTESDEQAKSEFSLL